MDADFSVFDPGASFKVQRAGVLHRHSLTPYLGMELTGTVLQTYVRGHRVYDHGSFGRPQGELL